MRIEPFEFYTSVDSDVCGEHSNNHTSFLLYLANDSVIVTMCQTCIDEMYEQLLPHVSTEVRKRNEGVETTETA